MKHKKPGVPPKMGGGGGKGEPSKFEGKGGGGGCHLKIF